ncbi:hypothetical protein [Streptomyces sp. NBC_01306]|uniref:hypothetical protein n=1 Tax=Streptomyces sp. NBC_01306 TaxID=2903819 RepID=UPI0022516B64|nr:hypothetical protein [Streptomyces sp. NBC_01306]MCX4728334.1 hypothetical protein [Streptomyces sp. NBC_01306]
MNSERAERLVTALRARGVMAHVAEVGVYQFGVRVVIDWNIEALWDTDGAAGLDAQVLSDGMLVGFVPHIGGSEDFTEEQLVEAIATTSYSTEGLRPPTRTETETGRGTSTGTAASAGAGTGTGTDAGGVGEPDLPSDIPGAPAPPPPAADRPAGPPDHRRPKGHWWRR